MESSALNQRARLLVDKLTSGCDDYYGKGFMSSAIYDTAWVSLIVKPVGDSKIWLFPKCFTFILDNQKEDGSWVSYASQIDGILNTAASLLSLKRHHASIYQIKNVSEEDLSSRIVRASTALQSLLSGWDVRSTVHVGFEILVPALLEYLKNEGLEFRFPQEDVLSQIHQQKLLKFRPEYLYGKVQLTALHSLEAFIGKIDFDRVGHHKRQGSFMASPSSTAAYLMNSSVWDDECEEYLRHVVAYGAGMRIGGVPSAFPSNIFELTWSISTLLEGGFDLDTIAPFPTSKAVEFLKRCFENGNGVVGFTPHVGADADDTSKTILILNWLNHSTSPDGLLQQFEDRESFKTYQQERDPSFSANCNVLIALLHVKDPSQYASQIEKTARFLWTKFQESKFGLRDKWNISPFYSMMLMTQASTRLVHLWNTGVLPGLPDELLRFQIPQLLFEVAISTLRSQKPNGSWGLKESREETAYAVLVLANTLALTSMKELEAEVRSAINQARTFLDALDVIQPEHLWVEKVTYASEILSESYVLAALNIGLPPLAPDLPSSEELVPHTNGLHVNGAQTNGAHENGIQVNGAHPNIAPEHGTQIKKEEPDRPHLNGTYVNGTELKTVQTNGEEVDGTIKEAVVSRWNTEKEKILLGPFDYLEKHPGKDMRSQFIAAFNTWLDVPPEKLKIIEKVVRMLHTASLLVDDIEDNSDLRRGVPVAHSIFGVPQTFNSGNYVYFLALQEVRNLDNPKAIDVFVEELINLHRGQGMDLFWRDSLTCPTEDDYLEMVGNKTGGLFCLAIRLMQAESRTGRDLVPLITLLGLQFQICDDYLNLMSTTYTQNKGLCEDLTEGKFSFPIIHSIRSDPSNRQLINILKQKPREAEVKRYAVSYIENTGSFEYTRKVVADLKSKALALIEGYESEGWGEAVGIRKLLTRMDLT